MYWLVLMLQKPNCYVFKFETFFPPIVVKMWEKKIRFVITVIFICVQTPFFITVLFYNALLFAPGNKFMQSNRALFATLSVSMWAPWLGLKISTQITPKLSSPGILPRVFLCTHQSFADAIVLALVFWLFRKPLGPGVALYKRELASVPILGQLQKYSGNIPVARSGDVEAAKRSLATAARRAREGYHVSGFPEGSRRRTPSTGKRDQLLPLKKGFFHLISDDLGQVEIFPVVLKGSLRAWRAGSAVPEPGNKVTVRVGEPVVVSARTDVETLRITMTERMGEEIESLYEISDSDDINYLRSFGFEMVLSVIPMCAALISFFST